MTLSVEETEILEAISLAERAKAITNIVSNTYFSQNIDNSENLWRLGVLYTDYAELISTATCLLFDAIQILDKTLDEAGKAETE